MKETVCELNELKYDMESERLKLGYTDPSRPEQYRSCLALEYFMFMGSRKSWRGPYVYTFWICKIISSDRIPVKTFIESVESFLQDQISGGFNKLVQSALYPPEGAEPPTIPQLESAWADLLPTVISNWLILT